MCGPGQDEVVTDLTRAAPLVSHPDPVAQGLLSSWGPGSSSWPPKQSWCSGWGEGNVGSEPSQHRARLCQVQKAGSQAGLWNLPGKAWGSQWERGGSGAGSARLRRVSPGWGQLLKGGRPAGAWASHSARPRRGAGQLCRPLVLHDRQVRLVISQHPDHTEEEDSSRSCHRGRPEPRGTGPCVCSVGPGQAFLDGQVQGCVVS